MKRTGNLYERICSIENLQLADFNASKGKAHQYGVIVHRKNQAANILALRETLLDKSYQTSAYTMFKIYEPKQREVFRLPYFPDRICHHAIMNVLEPVFTRLFTADTYACVKGRGIHGAARAVRRALVDQVGTQYCLKLDVRKFYPSIDHEILKAILRRKFKDQDLLWLLDEIIDSAAGIPIGNYLSQYFANLYLTSLDHWMKETKSVRYYFRYADDLVILARGKDELHQLLADIKTYLQAELNLEVKSNHQVFPVAARSIDFVGYRFYHTHTMLRKSIKKSFAKAVANCKNTKTVAAYYGWATHCNSLHLLKKLFSNEKFQRFQHQTKNHWTPRRQDQDRKIVQSRNYHPRSSDPGLEIRRQRFRQMPLPADRVERDKTCGVHRLPVTNGSDLICIQGRLPF
jgi:RNA-directed DNA polymerase